MVSLDCWSVFKDCIDSLKASEPSLGYEIIVVDNASSDGTPQKIRDSFPDIQLIQNGSNVGFTKATNQAIRSSSGQYIVWLNTDTILKPGTLSKLCGFLEKNPKAGIVGPKVLNGDGTFQPQCRRGMPTPSAILFYMLKINRLFPNHPVVGQYLLSYLPVDRASQVTAVSGSCLMTRRQVWEQVGPLDEDVFGFGEDIDWCVRAQKAGWEIWYYPQSEIVHLKGQGGVHSKPYHKVFGIHQSMWTFYRKHLKSNYSAPVTALVWIGVHSSLILSLIGVWLRQAGRLDHI